MLLHLVSLVGTFIATHPHLAYTAVLLAGAAESTPVVGLVLPGSTVMVALGALVPSGVLALWPLLAAATVGAIIGDGVSFWLARRYHRVLRNVWPLSRHPALLARGETFFVRHGDKSAFLCRFVPGMRAFVPPAAGMLRMPPRRFYVANILSAVIWAPAHILLGVALGTAFGQLGAAAKPLAALIVLLLALTWVVTQIVRILYRNGIPRLVYASRRWRSHYSIHGFSLRLGQYGLVALVVLAVVLIGAAWLAVNVLNKTQ